VRIDKAAKATVSQESGRLARVWNHTLSFREVAPGAVSYTDEIEIQAGWLTPGIWLFAQVFYRYRQRRWKALLPNQGLPRPLDERGCGPLFGYAPRPGLKPSPAEW
jgi:hypothetical protein